MGILFGPTGLGPVKEAIKNLEYYNKLGFKACEVLFTYGIYIKDKDTSLIKQTADRLNIKLSIHAPYFVNLNSIDKNIIKKSKERIIESCRIGEKLGAYRVVIHSGYYGKMDKVKTYENIKNQIIELNDTIKSNSWKIKLAPETMGKINVFGDILEIANLSKDTGSAFCIDFAHILARYNENKFDEIKEKFKSYDTWHCHFSGIEYGEKGEKKHIQTKNDNWENLIKNLPKNKDITIINESPYAIKDSIEGLKMYNSVN